MRIAQAGAEMRDRRHRRSCGQSAVTRAAQISARAFALCEPMERRTLLCIDPTTGAVVPASEFLHPTQDLNLADAARPAALAAGVTQLLPDLSPWVSTARGFVHNWQIDKTTEPGRTLQRLSFA